MARTTQVGAAGEHWVVSELLLRGLLAIRTGDNALEADVLVQDPATGALASLQVKTSGESGVDFWPATVPRWTPRTHFYVFLRRQRVGGGFESFLVESAEVASDVRANFEVQRSRGTQPFGEFRLPRDRAAIDRLRQAWESWRPLANS